MARRTIITKWNPNFTSLTGGSDQDFLMCNPQATVSSRTVFAPAARLNPKSRKKHRLKEARHATVAETENKLASPGGGRSSRYAPPGTRIGVLKNAIISETVRVKSNEIVRDMVAAANVACPIRELSFDRVFKVPHDKEKRPQAGATSSSEEFMSAKSGSSSSNASSSASSPSKMAKQKNPRAQQEVPVLKRRLSLRLAALERERRKKTETTPDDRKRPSVDIHHALPIVRALPKRVRLQVPPTHRSSSSPSQRPMPCSRQQMEQLAHRVLATLPPAFLNDEKEKPDKKSYQQLVEHLAARRLRVVFENSPSSLVPAENPDDSSKSNQTAAMRSTLALTETPAPLDELLSHTHCFDLDEAMCELENESEASEEARSRHASGAIPAPAGDHDAGISSGEGSSLTTFERLFEQTFHSSTLAHLEEVLAEKTEPEPLRRRRRSGERGKLRKDGDDEKPANKETVSKERRQQPQPQHVDNLWLDGLAREVSGEKNDKEQLEDAAAEEFFQQLQRELDGK